MCIFKAEKWMPNDETQFEYSVCNDWSAGGYPLENHCQKWKNQAFNGIRRLSRFGNVIEEGKKA